MNVPIENRYYFAWMTCYSWHGEGMLLRSHLHKRMDLAVDHEQIRRRVAN